MYKILVNFSNLEEVSFEFEFEYELCILFVFENLGLGKIL